MPDEGPPGEAGDGEPEQAETDDDPTSWPEAKVLAHIELDGKDLAIVDVKDVPLRVIADLVESWRRKGEAGRWNLGKLEYAARAEGQGNHAWYLAFSSDDSTYRVSYGGRGKREHGTVRRAERGPS